MAPQAPKQIYMRTYSNNNTTKKMQAASSKQ
jgi:hypothetical protein